MLAKSMKCFTAMPIMVDKSLDKNKIKRRKRSITNSFTALSLFSGGGGLDLGFAAAGFKIGCSSDIDPFSCNTLLLNKEKKNFYTHASAITADIKKITAKDILKEAQMQKGSVDIIIGGPPCQAFSVFGQRKGLTDPRGNLVWEYLRIVKEVQPKAFVFENVSGIKTIHDGKLFKDILKKLTLDGTYAVSAHSYEVADFGIPQFRNRVFIIGAQNGVIVPPMIPTHGEGRLKKHRTVKEALRFLPAPEISNQIPNHIGRKHSERIITRYRDLEFGERDPKTRINKLNPSRPSYTIIVGSDNGGGKGHVHPIAPREVTPRESARMQTFPDWWEFYGVGRHVIRQVGNAVPPLFSAIIAEHIKQHVFGEKKKRTYEDFIKILRVLS